MYRFGITGNLGQDAKVKQTSDNSKIIVFNVAVNRNYVDKDSGEIVENTEWVGVTLNFDKFKNTVPYLKKGTWFFGEGVPFINSYKKEDGKRVEKINMRAFKFEFKNSNNDKKDK
jgi:single-strand DNA-binding protein